MHGYSQQEFDGEELVNVEEDAPEDDDYLELDETFDEE